MRASRFPRTTEQTRKDENSLLERFLLAQQVEENKAPLTCRNYRDWLRPFFQWLAERDPLQVADEDLHAYLAGVFREFENPYIGSPK